MNDAPDVTLIDITQRVHGTAVLDGVSATIAGGAITGLFGRNGAGKSTLAGIIAGWRRPSAGTAEVGGRPVWGRPEVTADVLLAWPDPGLLSESRVAVSLRFIAAARPRWSAEAFEHCLRTFELPRAVLNRQPGRLSTGQRAAVSASIALAARAPVTLLDEVSLGMDVVARQRLHELLLEEYIAHPRTLIISTHAIDEVQHLVEDSLILHDRRVLAHGPTDEIRARHGLPSEDPTRPARLLSLGETVAHLTETVNA